VKLLEEPPLSSKPARNTRATHAVTSTPQSPARDSGGRISDAGVNELCSLFKLLADDTRLRILNLLLQTKEHHVRALCEKLGQSQPAVSHHLALLRMAGLIECRRDGKHNFYRLSPKRLEALLDNVLTGAANGPHRESMLQLGKYSLRRDL
jgi:ArsR family transcriptional regulator, arsenate/arsenite/antimonite-responsive transcriptional repressor